MNEEHKCCPNCGSKNIEETYCELDKEVRFVTGMHCNDCNITIKDS